MREYNWRASKGKYGHLISHTATLESIFEHSRILHNCADGLQPYPAVDLPILIKEIADRRVIISRNEEEELNNLLKKKGQEAVIKALRQKAEQYEKAAKEMADEIEWPKESKWNALNGREKRAALRGILIALRVAGEKHPTIRAREILARTKFEQELPKYGEHSAAGEFNINTKVIRIAKKDEIKKSGFRRVESRIANVIAHETSHKLGLSHAVTSAIGHYAGFVHGSKEVFMPYFTDYSKKEIVNAREPPLKRELERKKSNSYYLGWRLGSDAYQLEVMSKKPHAGIKFLYNIAKGMGSREAREAVLGSK